MDQYEFIRMAYRVYGKGIRQIAREFKHSRKTVRKALAGLFPGYRMSEPRKCPVMDGVQVFVDQWLVEDQSKPKKQRHTAKRIFDRLVAEHGFRGTESTVRHFVRKRKAALGQEAVEAMVPLEAHPTGEAEVDWGEAVVKINGKEQKVKLFAMRPRYSGKPFMRAYFSEAQEMFFDAHIHAFAYFGGVFPLLVYDNLKTAVAKVYKGKKRDEQRWFKEFRAYYTFRARFCNPARGNEKGGVEGSIKDLRRNLLVPIIEAESLEDLNQKLIEGCQRWSERILGGREQRRTIAAWYDDEKSSLLALPATPFEAQKLTVGKVNKYQTIQVDKVRYSVPTVYVGRAVQVALTCDQVKIVCNGKEIAKHRRAFVKDSWVLEPHHYFGLLRHKIGAFDRAKPLASWRSQWPQSHERLLESWRKRHGETEGSRAFLEVLTLYERHPADEVEVAVELAVERGVNDPESVRCLLQVLQDNEPEPLRVLAARLPEECRVQHEPPNLAKYDALTEVSA